MACSLSVSGMRIASGVRRMTGCGLRKGRAATNRKFSAIVVHMPKLSPTHVEGVVSKWLVSEGDAVEACDLVAHLDADDVYDGSDPTGRVTMLLETHDDGVVAELLRFCSR